MDNFHIDVTARGKKALAAVIDLAFEFNCPGPYAKSWAILQISKSIARPLYGIDADLVGAKVLLFRWDQSLDLKEFKDQDVTQGGFPFKANSEHATDFAWRWLEDVDMGPEPDMDGDCERGGWRAFIGSWGHFGPDHYSIIAIKPEWVMIGK